MPVYEFFCDDCHAVFNFFSRTVNTTKRPDCPWCGKKDLTRWMSVFSVSRNRPRPDEDEIEDFDAARMEKAMDALAGEAENLNEDDPGQSAQFMRKLSDMAGMSLGPGMEEALSRMEQGDSIEAIEADLGDRLEEEGPFFKKALKAGSRARTCAAPKHDPTLYDL